MVEFTTSKTMKDIRAHGYMEIGIYTEDNEHLDMLIDKAKEKNKYDLLLLQLNIDKNNIIYQVYERFYE